MKADFGRIKRTVIPAFAIGLLVAGLVSLLHAYGILSRPETALADLISRHFVITQVVMGKVQYVFVVLLALGVAWTAMAGFRRGWAWWLVSLLLLELIGVSWVCALYHVFFQPLPSILAVVLTFLLVYVHQFATGGRRARRATEIFSTRLSSERLEHLIQGKFDLESAASHHEATVLVCDIANKHDLAESLSPETIAAMFDRFVGFARETLVREGAYVSSADGEGVVAIFGFPVEDEKHAENAARVTLLLQEKFGELRKSTPDLFGWADLHFGISSGTMVAARFQNDQGTGIVPVGESLELARRLCRANRTYGSRILLGPQTFDLAEKATIARPIDFFSGSTASERFEIYELLALSRNAKPEEVMRRDSFWNGVVYFREQRWEEAYAEFQKAWGDNGHNDVPLQSYLRRLEPRVLNLGNPAVPGEVLTTL